VVQPIKTGPALFSFIAIFRSGEGPPYTCGAQALRIERSADIIGQRKELERVQRDFD